MALRTDPSSGSAYFWPLSPWNLETLTLARVPPAACWPGSLVAPGVPVRPAAAAAAAAASMPATDSRWICWLASVSCIADTCAPGFPTCCGNEALGATAANCDVRRAAPSADPIGAALPPARDCRDRRLCQLCQSAACPSGASGVMPSAASCHASRAALVPAPSASSPAASASPLAAAACRLSRDAKAVLARCWGAAAPLAAATRRPLGRDASCSALNHSSCTNVSGWREGIECTAAACTARACPGSVHPERAHRQQAG
jgi:hypothetical protein